MSKAKPLKDAQSMVVTVGNPSWFPPFVPLGIDVADIMARVEKLRREKLRKEQEHAAGEGE